MSATALEINVPLVLLIASAVIGLAVLVVFVWGLCAAASIEMPPPPKKNGGDDDTAS